MVLIGHLIGHLMNFNWALGDNSLASSPDRSVGRFTLMPSMVEWRVTYGEHSGAQRSHRRQGWHLSKLRAIAGIDPNC